MTLCLSSSALWAVDTTWDGDSGSDVDWATPGNWSNGAPTSTDNAIFTDVGAAAAGTVTSEVTTDMTIRTLTFNGLTTGTQQTVQIDAGVTLSLVAAGSSPQILLVGGNTTGTAGTATVVAFQGDGALVIDGASRDVDILNGNSLNATLDLSGLATFTANVDEFRVADRASVGNVNNLRGTVLLAQDSTITANSISLGGGSSGSNYHIARMELGQTTELNVGTLTVGGYKASGYLNFQEGVVDGSLKIRGAGGGETSVSTWAIGRSDGSGSADTLGNVDLTGGSLDAKVTDLYLGFGNSVAAGYVRGSLSYDSGSVTATNAYIGYQFGNATTVNSNDVTGTVTLGGDATFTVNNLTIGESVQETSVRTTEGLFIVNGGSLTVNTSAKLATTATGSSTIADVTGELRINGGSVTINAADGLQTGAETTNASGQSILTINGGALDMTGKVIGSSANHIKTLNFNAGQISNVAEINGGDSDFTKTTAGVLTIAGTNTYTGATLVTEGTLILDGSITSDATVSSEATLGGAGSTTGAVNLGSGSALAPGQAGAIGTLGAASLVWDGGATMEFQLSGVDNTSDRVTLTGEFTMGLAGVYEFDFLNTGMGAGVYTLLTFDSTTFTDADQFSYTGLAGGLTGDFTLGANSLTFTAVPEPGTVALLVSAGGVFLLLRRRRGGQQ